jgi:hypothetical protein
VSKFSELYKMSEDGMSVRAYDLPNEFCDAYKLAEVFKYAPRPSSELKETYTKVNELYKIRMSPTIVSLVSKKEDPDSVSIST